MTNEEVIGCTSASLLKFSSLLEALEKVDKLKPTDYVLGEIDTLRMVVKDLQASGVEMP